MRTIYTVIALLTLAVSVLAGIPPISYIGEVLDAETNKPLSGVDVVVFADDWPEDAQKPGVFTTETDSAGVYHLPFQRSAEVLFFKTGYDSVFLHWPEEFEQSEQGGCGVNLAPVRLTGIRRE